MSNDWVLVITRTDNHFIYFFKDFIYLAAQGSVVARDLPSSLLHVGYLVVARRIWFLNWECGILASEPPGKSLILTLKGEIAVVEIQLHIIHTHTHTHISYLCSYHNSYKQ